MAVRLQDIKHVDDKSQKLLCGYLRNIYNDDVGNGNDHQHIIPDLVLNICLLFYFRGDYFEMIVNGNTYSDCEWDNFILSNNDKTVEKVDGCFGNLYGKIKIDSLSQIVCQWRIKIMNAMYVELGVSADVSDEYFYGSFRLPNNTFVCNGNHRVFGVCKVSDYHWMKWNNDDVVDIKLDLTQRNIEYFLNDKSAGVLFEDIPVGVGMEYRLVIYMGHSNHMGTCVSIEYFQRK